MGFECSGASSDHMLDHRGKPAPTDKCYSTSWVFLNALEPRLITCWTTGVNLHQQTSGIRHLEFSWVLLSFLEFSEFFGWVFLIFQVLKLQISTQKCSRPSSDTMLDYWDRLAIDIAPFEFSWVFWVFWVFLSFPRFQNTTNTILGWFEAIFYWIRFLSCMITLYRTGTLWNSELLIFRIFLLEFSEFS